MKLRNLFKNQILQIGLVLILLLFFLFKLNDIYKYYSSFMTMITPILVSFAIAFILNIIVKLLEDRLIYKFFLKSKTKKNLSFVRGISIFLSIIIILSIISTLLLFIVPKLIESIIQLANAAPKYLIGLENNIKKMSNLHSTSSFQNAIYTEIIKWSNSIATTSASIITTALSSLISVTISFTSGVIDFLMSTILAIYMLFSKELLLKQCKKVIYAFFNTYSANKIIYVAKTLETSFASFITGQCTEAFIIAILSFILMTILKIPYALLIASLLGFTGIIPILGAFIGTIPAILLLLMINPVKALTFLIAIILLQQVESNIIYPRVVGSSVGLSSLWIMIAIIIGGYLNGVIGILIGIPLISAFYKLFSEYINFRLSKK